jgi:hypothetical protein
LRRKNKKKNLPKRKKPVATETTPKPSFTYKGSHARLKVVLSTITVAGILFFWSVQYFNPSNLQRFTNISLVILTAIAALRDLRDTEKKITKWGWFFSILSVLTAVAFSVQTISPQEIVFKNFAQGVEKITYLPGRTDTVYKTDKSFHAETNRPVLEILGPAEYSETDSSGHFKVRITVIDDVPARINSASSVLFTPNMIKGKLEARGFRAHALDNSIVTKELSILFVQNASKNGAATDTVYSYLKIGYTDRNRTMREEMFTRLYICAKNSNGTYDVFYRARAEDVKAMEYLKSQKLH